VAERMSLTGRTAVVTGAAAGIGRAIAVSLARRGCNLAIADIDEESARRHAKYPKLLRLPPEVAGETIMRHRTPTIARTHRLERKDYLSDRTLFPVSYWKLLMRRAGLR